MVLPKVGWKINLAGGQKIFHNCNAVEKVRGGLQSPRKLELLKPNGEILGEETDAYVSALPALSSQAPEMLLRGGIIL